MTVSLYFYCYMKKFIYSVPFNGTGYRRSQKKGKIGNVAKISDRLFGRIKSCNIFSKLSNINRII